MDNKDFQEGQNPTPENRYQDYTAEVQYQPVPEETEPQNNTLSIVSLVLGILSIVACCAGAGFMLGIGGIICSVFARKQGKNGMNTGGLICSIIGVVLGAISTIVMIIFYVAMFAAGI